MFARSMLLAALCFAPLAVGCRTSPVLANDAAARRLTVAVRLAAADPEAGLPADHPLAEAHRLLAAAN